MKYLHYYDIDNDWLYLMSSEAFLDVEETKKQGRNVYYCPYNATLVELPKLKQQEVARFNGINWDILKDYRGKYQIDTNMEISEINYVGDIQEGYILLTDEQYNIIVDDADYFIIKNGELVKNPDYEEIKRKKHRKELDSLTLTPADVERALYRAKGMDFDDLKALIAQSIPSIDLKGLAIEFRAKDFYRGAEADGIRLFDVVGQLLGYSPTDMDYLFKNKKLPDVTTGNISNSGEQAS